VGPFGIWKRNGSNGGGIDSIFLQPMDREESGASMGPSVPEGLGVDWAMFIQQQVQSVFREAIPQIVQQLSER